MPVLLIFLSYVVNVFKLGIPIRVTFTFNNFFVQVISLQPLNCVIEELKRTPKNVRFEVLFRAAELFGFLS